MLKSSLSKAAISNTLDKISPKEKEIYKKDNFRNR